jgi:hypothetical protein
MRRPPSTGASGPDRPSRPDYFGRSGSFASASRTYHRTKSRIASDRSLPARSHASPNRTHSVSSMRIVWRAVPRPLRPVTDLRVS